MAAITGNFGDLLDPRFQEIFNDEYDRLPDLKDKLHGSMTAKLYTERLSSVGTLPTAGQFTGTLAYNDVAQGYDVTVTPLEFAQGFSIQRRLFDTDQFDIMNSKPKALAEAMWRRIQTDAARMWNNAFSVDTFFANNSEGVALCSNSHTTTSGASTASGFDNLVTTALSAVAVASARIQMVGYRGDQAEPIAVMPSALLVPPDLYEIAYEIIGSKGKVDQATNNANVHYGQYELVEYLGFLTDTNNWLMLDMEHVKDHIKWAQAVETEFAMVEDFDTLVASWRSYDVHGSLWRNWRAVLGGSVS